MNALAILLAAVITQSPALKPLPDVALTDMQGKTVHLNSFLGKKLVLFNWASW